LHPVACGFVEEVLSSNPYIILFEEK